MKVLGGGESKQAPAFKADVKKKPAGTWTLGTRVKHAKYGYGTILRTEGAGDDLKLTVSFPGIICSWCVLSMRWNEIRCFF